MKLYTSKISMPSSLKSGEMISWLGSSLVVNKIKKEIVLNGTENWQNYKQEQDGYGRMQLTIDDIMQYSTAESNYYATANYDDYKISGSDVVVCKPKEYYSVMNVFIKDCNSREDFINKLKEKNVTVIYKLTKAQNVPLNSLGINIYSFDEETYVTTSNLIKPFISFNVPTNLRASIDSSVDTAGSIASYLENNSDNINNIPVIEKAMTTAALNVIDLKNQVSDNNSVTTVKDESNIKIDSKTDGVTENIIIKGNGVANLIYGDAKVVRTKQDSGIKYTKLPISGKNNTVYTLVLDVTKNTTTQNAQF